MLRIKSMARMKRAWSLALSARNRGDSKCPGKYHRLSVMRAQKSTHSRKDIECQKCKQILEYLFSPLRTHDEIRKIQAIILSDIKRLQKSIADNRNAENRKDVKAGYQLGPQAEYEQCTKILAAIFNEDKSQDSNKVPKSKRPIKDVEPGETLLSTTAKQTEEQLAQKVEVIEETPLVEAHTPKITGFNTPPRTLGNVDKDSNSHREVEYEMNTRLSVRHKFDKLVRRLESAEMFNGIKPMKYGVVNFSSKGSNQSGKSGDSTGGDKENEYDSIAKKFLDNQGNPIDPRLVKEMKRLGVPTGTSDLNSSTKVHASKKPQNPTEKTEIETEIQNCKNDPPVASGDDHSAEKAQIRRFQPDYERNVESELLATGIRCTELSTPKTEDTKAQDKETHKHNLKKQILFDSDTSNLDEQKLIISDSKETGHKTDQSLLEKSNQKISVKSFSTKLDDQTSYSGHNQNTSELESALTKEAKGQIHSFTNSGKNTSYDSLKQDHQKKDNYLNATNFVRDEENTYQQATTEKVPIYDEETSMSCTKAVIATKFARHEKEPDQAATEKGPINEETQMSSNKKLFTAPNFATDKKEPGQASTRKTIIDQESPMSHSQMKAAQPNINKKTQEINELQSAPDFTENQKHITSETKFHNFVPLQCQNYGEAADEYTKIHENTGKSTIHRISVLPERLFYSYDKNNDPFSDGANRQHAWPKTLNKKAQDSDKQDKLKDDADNKKKETYARDLPADLQADDKNNPTQYSGLKTTEKQNAPTPSSVSSGPVEQLQGALYTPAMTNEPDKSSVRKPSQSSKSTEIPNLVGPYQYAQGETFLVKSDPFSEQLSERQNAWPKALDKLYQGPEQQDKLGNIDADYKAPEIIVEDASSESHADDVKNADQYSSLESKVIHQNAPTSVQSESKSPQYTGFFYHIPQSWMDQHPYSQKQIILFEDDTSKGVADRQHAWPKTLNKKSQDSDKQDKQKKGDSDQNTPDTYERDLPSSQTDDKNTFQFSGLETTQENLGPQQIFNADEKPESSKSPNQPQNPWIQQYFSKNLIYNNNILHDPATLKEAQTFQELPFETNTESENPWAQHFGVQDVFYPERQQYYEGEEAQEMQESQESLDTPTQTENPWMQQHYYVQDATNQDELYYEGEEAQETQESEEFSETPTQTKNLWMPYAFYQEGQQEQYEGEEAQETHDFRESSKTYNPSENPWMQQQYYVQETSPNQSAKPWIQQGYPYVPVTFNQQGQPQYNKGEKAQEAQESSETPTKSGNPWIQQRYHTLPITLNQNGQQQHDEEVEAQESPLHSDQYTNVRMDPQFDASKQDTSKSRLGVTLPVEQLTHGALYTSDAIKETDNQGQDFSRIPQQFIPWVQNPHAQGLSTGHQLSEQAHEGQNTHTPFKTIEDTEKRPSHDDNKPIDNKNIAPDTKETIKQESEPRIKQVPGSRSGKVARQWTVYPDVHDADHLQTFEKNPYYCHESYTYYGEYPNQPSQNVWVQPISPEEQSMSQELEIIEHDRNIPQTSESESTITPEQKKTIQATDAKTNSKHPKTLPPAAPSAAFVSLPQQIWKQSESPLPQKEATSDSLNPSVNSALPELNIPPLPKDESIPLPENLNRVRQGSRQECLEDQARMDPIEGKCGRPRRPCPPPTPTCPQPGAPPPPPCPPPPPACPKACKPRCAPACAPPQTKCPPKNTPTCKFERTSLGDSLHNTFTLLWDLGLRGLAHRQPSSSESCLINPDVCATKATTTADLMAQLQKLRNNLLTTYSSNLGKYFWKLETLALARDFEPWVPIPAWPLPLKKDKKELVCPKEGCKQKPPPRLGDPCDPPCGSSNTCLGFPHPFRKH